MARRVDRAAHSADCLAWGGFGYGNAGDELLLDEALYRARRRFGTSVAVLSVNPDDTRRQFPCVRVVPLEARRRPAWQRALRRGARTAGFQELGTEYRLADQLEAPRTGWMEAIARCRVLLLSGGGYLTDLHDLDLRLLPLDAARHFSVPVFTRPLGIGPFHSAAAEGRTFAVLRGARVLVRDRESHRLCADHGVPAALVRDDGFSAVRRLDIVKAARSGLLRVGICCHAQSGAAGLQEWFVWWARLLKALRARDDIELGGFCYHAGPHEDQAVLRRLFRECGLDSRGVPAPSPDFREIVRQVAEFEVIVSSRFHAVVSARAAGVPAFAVASGPYYEPKMRCALVGPGGTAELVLPGRDTPEAIAARVLGVLHS
ncbi:polysaccharide pyruvyl transferase family protein [Candidatus Poribacteria bacterium]|nr:polysaccharide pyruvyl transferase family protein [Candidatus Poribacteria bacterium]